MARKPQKAVSITRSSAAEYLTFIAASGESGVQAVYADEEVWLTQKMMGVLYDVASHTITYHLQKYLQTVSWKKKQLLEIFE